MSRKALPWKEFERRTRAFRDAREHYSVSDTEFTQKIFHNPSEMEREIACVIRRIVARDCGVRAEQIDGFDPTCELTSVMGSEGFCGWLFGGPYGFYFSDFFTRLCLELDKITGSQVKISPADCRVLAAFGGKDGDLSFGEWVHEATREAITLVERARVEGHVKEVEQEGQDSSLRKRSNEHLPPDSNSC